jgi:hypothetical protein
MLPISELAQQIAESLQENMELNSETRPILAAKLKVVLSEDKGTVGIAPKGLDEGETIITFDRPDFINHEVCLAFLEVCIKKELRK